MTTVERRTRFRLFCVLALLCLGGCGGADGGETGTDRWAETAAGAEVFQPPEQVSTAAAHQSREEGTAEPSRGEETAGQPPKAAALTFDDGPHPGTTDRLLDGLRERGVRATFFLVGEEAAGNRDLVRRIAAEGHQAGNHTWSHRRLEDMEREEIAQEIGKTEALLSSILGGGGYWVRPPYGLLRPGTEDLAGAPLVKWSVDPRDWESRNREKIVSAVLDSLEPGSIVLLHDIYPASVDAALDIADRLGEQGYALVTVEELLRLYGREPVSGEMVRSATG